MNENIIEKGFEAAAYLAEANILLSSLGLGYSFFNGDQILCSCTSFTLGLNVGFFLYNSYQVLVLDKSNSLKERKIVSSKETSNQYVKSLYQK